MQLTGTKRLKDGRQMLPAGGYSEPTENQGIMDMETGEIIALSKKDQRIADAKKNRKQILEKLQAKVDKENAEKLALSEKEKKAKKKETLKLLEGRLTRVLDGLDAASTKVEEIKKQQTGKSTPKLEGTPTGKVVKSPSGRQTELRKEANGSYVPLKSQTQFSSLFNDTKTNGTVDILYSSPASASQPAYVNFKVGRKTVSKNGVERRSLTDTSNPRGMKSYLYNRDGRISFAHGDVAAKLIDFE